MNDNPSGYRYRKFIFVLGGFFLCALGIFFFVFRSSRVVVITEGDMVKNRGLNVIATSTASIPTSTAQTPTGAVLSSTTAIPIPRTPLVIASATPMFIVPMTPVDIAAYDAKILQLAHLPARRSTSTATSTIITGKPGPWPVRSMPYPNPGALLPFNRIVAYYGNLYSKQMGILGQYPAAQMLAMLTSTTREWALADPTTPVIPALDYIAVTAQGFPQDGTYRLRMPGNQINQIVQMAAQVNGAVILDIQVGLSTVQKEIPLLAPYLKLPQVHLALDPEFDMHNGEKPGTVIGTMDATEINWVAEYLANLVRENNLPPKILIVHRFTEDMVTNYKKIAPTQEVQIVMDMDGFGSPAKKIGTYTQVVAPEPVQFTGFKLFYKNDAVTYGNHLMTPSEVLKLSPQPSFIQYQ